MHYKAEEETNKEENLPIASCQKRNASLAAGCPPMTKTTTLKLKSHHNTHCHTTEAQILQKRTRNLRSRMLLQMGSPWDSWCHMHQLRVATVHRQREFAPEYFLTTICLPSTHKYVLRLSLPPARWPKQTPLGVTGAGKYWLGKKRSVLGQIILIFFFENWEFFRQHLFLFTPQRAFLLISLILEIQ